MNTVHILTDVGQGVAEKVVYDLSDAMSIESHMLGQVIYLTGEILTQLKSDAID